MAESASVDVDETIKSLDKFSNAIRIKVTRIASRRGAKIVKSEMEQLAPVDEGVLREGIVARTKVDQGGGKAYSVIGPFGKVATTVDGIDKKRSQSYKGRFLENGTVNMSAKPFIAKSLENTRSKVEGEYDDSVDKELKKI